MPGELGREEPRTPVPAPVSTPAACAGPCACAGALLLPLPCASPAASAALVAFLIFFATRAMLLAARSRSRSRSRSWLRLRLRLLLLLLLHHLCLRFCLSPLPFLPSVARTWRAAQRAVRWRWRWRWRWSLVDCGVLFVCWVADGPKLDHAGHKSFDQSVSLSQRFSRSPRNPHRFNERLHHAAREALGTWELPLGILEAVLYSVHRNALHARRRSGAGAAAQAASCEDGPLAMYWR